MRALYRKEACHPEDPRLLGFEAQRVLLEAFHAAETAGEPFDYVAFLEDDILLTDADFFLKLRCFNQAFGDHYLLMPNRIETMERQGQLRRFYIDGDYNPAASEAYRHSTEQLLCFPHLGEMVRFEQPSNLHSGCFFLNRAQARTYAGSGHAAAIDTSFHGPLESAATLGMLKTFQLMKPAPKTAASSPLNMVGAISWVWCPSSSMAEQHALIDWPLTPYTGWGNYGIQLAQALLEQGRYVPRLLGS